MNVIPTNLRYTVWPAANSSTTTTSATAGAGTTTAAAGGGAAAQQLRKPSLPKRSTDAVKNVLAGGKTGANAGAKGAGAAQQRKLQVYAANHPRYSKHNNAPQTKKKQQPQQQQQQQDDAIEEEKNAAAVAAHKERVADAAARRAADRAAAAKGDGAAKPGNSGTTKRTAAPVKPAAAGAGAGAAGAGAGAGAAAKQPAAAAAKGKGNNKKKRPTRQQPKRGPPQTLRPVAAPLPITPQNMDAAAHSGQLFASRFHSRKADTAAQWIEQHVSSAALKGERLRHFWAAAERNGLLSDSPPQLCAADRGAKLPERALPPAPAGAAAGDD
jgi:hypothetical protein